MTQKWVHKEVEIIYADNLDGDIDEVIENFTRIKAKALEMVKKLGLKEDQYEINVDTYVESNYDDSTCSIIIDLRRHENEEEKQKRLIEEVRHADAQRKHDLNLFKHLEKKLFGK